MMNIFYEAKGSPESILDLNLDDNPFVQMLDTFPVVLGLIRRLCDELGLQSSCDFQTSFTSQLLKEKQTTLKAITDDLMRFLSIRVSSSLDVVKQLHWNIKSIVRSFSGCELTGTSLRKQKDGKRVYIYKYSLLSSSDFISNVKKLALILKYTQ